MQVSNIRNDAAAPGATEEKPSLAVGQEAFLQLLLAQLRHQDPLKPIDSTEYVSQLAMLSGLEQSVQQNKKLEGLLVSSSLSQAAAIVGRKLTSADGTVSGLVVGARVTGDGVVAELSSGQTIAVTSGVKVGAP